MKETEMANTQLTEQQQAALLDFLKSQGVDIKDVGAFVTKEVKKESAEEIKVRRDDEHRKVENFVTGLITPIEGLEFAHQARITFGPNGEFEVNVLQPKGGNESKGTGERGPVRQTDKAAIALRKEAEKLLFAARISLGITCEKPAEGQYIPVSATLSDGTKPPLNTQGCGWNSDGEWKNFSNKSVNASKSFVEFCRKLNSTLPLYENSPEVAISRTHEWVSTL